MKTERKKEKSRFTNKHTFTFPSVFTGFPVLQTEGCEVRVEVEDVHQETKQEVEEDAQQEGRRMYIK